MNTPDTSRSLRLRRVILCGLLLVVGALGSLPFVEHWETRRKIGQWREKIEWLMAQENAIPAVQKPSGATPLPVLLDSDMVLTPEQSPYHVAYQTEVARGATLTVEPGVRIEFAPGAGLVALGTLLVRGDLANPVQLAPARSGAEWAGIFVGGTSSKTRLTHTELSGAYYGVKAVRARLDMEHCRFLNVREPYSGSHAHLVARHCQVAFTNFQARGNVNLFRFWKGSAEVVDCDIQCPPTDFKVDAFDVDHVERALFARTRIRGVTCEGADGIDVGVGSRQVRVVDCVITDFVDKGVSVGENARAEVENTVIARCAIGVGIKDEARAEIRGTTFFATGVGVECFEKSPGDGGGSAAVQDSVFAHVREREVDADAKSSLQVADCVSDKHLLEGRGNRLGIIRLIDPARGRFEVASFSPRPTGGVTPVGPSSRRRSGEVRTP